jgi:hypothetical protein
VVIFDGLTCVRKTITPSDCPPSAAPALGPCIGADLEPVFCFGGELKAPPRPVERSADLVLAGWAVNLFFLAQAAPFVAATSGIAAIVNPSCLYPMDVMLVGMPGHALYTGPSGVWFQVDIEESVNLGPFGGVHTLFADYTGQLSAGLSDSHTLPGWNRTYTIAPGGTLNYQWRMVLTRLHPNAPNINGVVENFSSRVTILGGSL